MAWQLIYPKWDYKSPYQDGKVDWSFACAPAKAPVSFNNIVFQVALWAIHASVVNTISSPDQPMTPPAPALLHQRVNWIVSQALFSYTRNKRYKALSLDWTTLPGIVVDQARHAVIIVPQEEPPPLPHRQPPVLPINPSPFLLNPLEWTRHQRPPPAPPPNTQVLDFIESIDV